MLPDLGRWVHRAHTKIFTPMRALGAEIAIYVDADFNPLYEYGKAHWGLGVKVRAQ